MTEPTQPDRWAILGDSRFWTFIAAQGFTLASILNFHAAYLPPLATWVSGTIAGLLALGVLHCEATGVTVAQRMALWRMPNHLRED